MIHRSDGERAFETNLRVIASERNTPRVVAEARTEYVFDEENDRKWRFDFAWPATDGPDEDARGGVAVEIDGGQWMAHGGRHARDSDREKMNEAVVQGWRILHFTPQDARDRPDHCIDLLLRLMAYEQPWRLARNART